MRTIQYPIPQAQPLGGIAASTVREFKGLNTFDPLSIPDSFFSDSSNMCSRDYPAASVREGYTVLGTPIGTKCTGLGVWEDKKLIGAFNDGTWRVWSGSAWSAPIFTYSSTDPEAVNRMWSFTNFQGSYPQVNLIGCNGMGGLYRYNGSTAISIAKSPLGSNFVTTYQNRLWVAINKEIQSCALDQPEVWDLFGGTDEDSYRKDIESSRGGLINALSGGLTKLTIGLPNEIRELYGGVPSDFSDRSVTEDLGFSNNQSVVTQEGIMRFLHKSGIYQYAGGLLPSKNFSEVVSNYPYTVDTDSAAGSDGSNLYFSVGDSLLVYDPREGVASWSVWKGIRATCFAQMGGDFYIGDAQGRVVKLGGSTDAGTPINWHATTKPFNNQAASQKSRWYKMWAVVELAAGSSLNVYLSRSVKGDSDWELVQTVNGTGIGVQRVIVPVSKYALENWVRVKIQGTGWARINELTRSTRQMPLY
ncbi:MAG: hypothetical protein ACE3L7_25535 [Candidatus Pristimantibacillus sp.]